MANQTEVENKKDHSDTKSNGSEIQECGPSTHTLARAVATNSSSTESDVIESEENKALVPKMLLKYLEPMLWKDLTQDADQKKLKKDCQLIRFCLDPNQKSQEEKSELEVYFDDLIHKWGKSQEIIRSMKEAKRFVGDMGLSCTNPYKFTRKLFFYAFFINMFLLQWDSSECESTFKNCYNEVKDDLIVLNNQIPFSILKKVHGWIAETWKAEKPIPDLTELILKCLFDQNCSASLNGESDDVFHLLGLFYKAYTKNWGTTINCDNGVGYTEKKTGFPCAKDLKESGVKFDVKYTNDLLDIFFEEGTLKIPFLIMDQRFLSILRNLVLYEKLVGKKYPVMSLVCFLKCLIQTEEDIRILHKARIKDKACNDKELPAILSDVCASARLDYQYHQLSGMCYKIDQFYLNKTNKWYYDFYKNYFYNPNAIMISGLGAVAFALYILNAAVNADNRFHGKNHSP